MLAGPGRKLGSGVFRRDSVIVGRSFGHVPPASWVSMKSTRPSSSLFGGASVASASERAPWTTPSRTSSWSSTAAFPTSKARSKIETWLFGIALRVAKDHRRTLQRKGEHEHLDEEPEDPQSLDPHEAAERSQAAAFLDRFLAKLDDEKRAVFILSELEEMTAPEIAEALAVNVNTVYSRLRAARNAFEAEVARQRKKERA